MPRTTTAALPFGEVVGGDGAELVGPDGAEVSGGGAVVAVDRVLAVEPPADALPWSVEDCAHPAASRPAAAMATSAWYRCLDRMLMPRLT
ncbi:MAG TPA: hypothetical protein VGC06_23390 [Actinomycetes bacterium]